MAPITVRVNPDDLRSIEHKLATMARPTLERIVERAAPYAQQQAKANAPRSTGALARSLTVEGHGLEARVVSPLPYALAAEFGRHAGTRMPPARAFGGPFAFVIARAVKQRGIKGRFFLQRARTMLENTELPRLLRTAVDELEAIWGHR